MTASRTLPAGWKRVVDGWTLRYERSDGAKVYQYSSRSNWGGRAWGAWAPGMPSGGAVGSTRAEAIRWVERHYPLVTMPTEDDFLAALGPCGK